MTLVDSTVIQALYSPEIWWVYELAGILTWFVARFFQRLGRDEHILGEFQRDGMFHQLGSYFVQPLKTTFKSRTGRRFYTEGKKVAYKKKGIFGEFNVIFHVIDRSRPRDAGVVEGKWKGLDFLTKSKATRDKEKAALPPKTEQEKATEVEYAALIINPLLVKGQEDPTSQDFEQFVGQEGMKQTLNASSGKQTFGPLMLAIVGILGAVAAALVIIVLLPHGIAGPSCPVGQVCTAVYTNTTAITHTTTGIP